MYVGVVKPRVAGKTFPALGAHAQPAILRIWQETNVGPIISYTDIDVRFTSVQIDLCKQKQLGQMRSVVSEACTKGRDK